MIWIKRYHKKKAYFQNFSWSQFYVDNLRMIMLCFIAPYTTVKLSLIDDN